MAADSPLERRTFLAGTGLAVATIFSLGTLPAEAKSTKAGRAGKPAGTANGCDCGCNQGPLTPTPLPSIPKAHTTVADFSSTGKIGVGGASKLGPVAVVPVLWKTTSGSLKVMELDPVDPDNPAMASAVNDLGSSVGTSSGTPILWAPDGSAKPLPLGGASRGQGSAIGNGGAIVGNLSQKGTGQGCRWVGGQVALLTMPGATDSQVRGVNSSGIACGAVLTDTWHPVIWEGTTGVALPLPPAYRGGIAHAISDDGIVVGEVIRRRSGKIRAAMWVDGHCIPVGPRRGHSTATGLSADGRVIGDFVGPDQRRRGFVARESHWVQLGASDVLSTAKAISTSGIVSGNSAVSGLAVPVTWTSPALA